MQPKTSLSKKLLVGINFLGKNEHSPGWAQLCSTSVVILTFILLHKIILVTFYKKMGFLDFIGCMPVNHQTMLANTKSKDRFEMKETLKGSFYDLFWPFFHKTEIIMVILRCFRGLTHNLFKNCDTKCKYFHFFCFMLFCTKTDIFTFFVICIFVFFVVPFVPFKI